MASMEFVFAGSVQLVPSSVGCLHDGGWEVTCGDELQYAQDASE